MHAFCFPQNNKNNRLTRKPSASEDSGEFGVTETRRISCCLSSKPARLSIGVEDATSSDFNNGACKI